MSKVNYRYEHNTTQKSTKFGPKHIKRLGKLKTIEGYRFRSTRSYISEVDNTRRYWSNTHERLRCRGENGQSLISGVCWGYGGSGPHAVKDILTACGISVAVAELVAFESKRGNDTGVDWRITFDNNGKFQKIEYLVD